METGTKVIGEGYAYPSPIANEGHDPHLLDGAEMVFDTWKGVTQKTIERCWAKSDFLQL